MAKAKTEVNPLSVERINELISDSGMTQKEFAEKVAHCTQQHMNRMARGNSPITAETAAQITKYFPKIRSEWILATVYKGNIIKNLIMDCQSYTKYRPNETTGGIFVSWRRKEELPTGA